MNDAYREPTHTELQSLVMSFLRMLGHAPQAEHMLANGKIADVWLSTQSGTAIFECKTCLTPFIVESVIMKYRSECNFLTICAPPAEIRQMLSRLNAFGFQQRGGSLGYVAIDWEGVVFHRKPEWRLYNDHDAGMGAGKERCTWAQFGFAAPQYWVVDGVNSDRV